MIERVADLWTCPADFRVITTNGTVRRDGCAVMGRGCARQAAQRWPWLPRMLGTRLKVTGNQVYFFSDEELGPEGRPERFGLFTFPVKHHWMERADPALIMESAHAFRRQLLASATYVMPRPGCGNGGLAWATVRPLLTTLPDNVIVVHFASEE